MTSWRPRADSRLLLLAILLAGWLLAVGGRAASAHAELIGTTPAAGERLPAAPPVIELEFTEAVSVVGESIRLLDAAGAAVDLGPVTAAGSTVRAEVPDLPEGGYVVDWQVVSADGHPISGAFTFAVGDAPLPEAPGGSSTGSTDQGLAVPILRGLTYTGMAGLIGVSAFVLWCWPDGARRREVGVLLACAAGLTLAAGALRLPAEASVLDATLAETLELRSGKAWLALALLGAVGFAFSPMLRSRLPGVARYGAWGAYGVAAGLAVAYAGHGAAGRAPVLGTALTVVHVVVAAVWVGGLVALAQCVLTGEARAAQRGATTFSSIATVCLLAVAATGTAQGVRQVGGFDDLTSTSYGRTLLVKVAVVAALVLVGLVGRRVVRGRSGAHLGTTSLPRTLAIESGLALVVLFTTGWLAGTPPGERLGGDTAVETPSGADGAEVTASEDGVNVSIRLAPAVVGENRLEVVVLSDDGRSPDQITLGLTPADGAIATLPVEPETEGAGGVAATVDVPYAGSWIVEVAARFGEFDLVELEVPVNVQP